MYKSDLKCSSAELVFGQTLRLPGDLCYDLLQPRINYPDDIVLDRQKFANTCKSIDTRVSPLTSEHMSKSLRTCIHSHLHQK